MDGITRSIGAFIDAVGAFIDRLAAVDWRLLGIALAFALANLVLRSRGWQNILRAALPESRVRYRSAFGAYCGGVGVNALIPARAGDLVKILMIRRSVPEAPVPLLAGTLVAETVFDSIVAGGLIIWVLASGALPGVRLPQIPAFDLSLAFQHPWITLAIIGTLVVLGLYAASRIRRFWSQFGRGLAILRTPRRYLMRVAAWQAVGWGCRLGGAYFFLGAFGVPATVRNALIVLVAGSLGALFPATPGGLGPKQALAVVMLAGEAGRSAVLAFSAGMEVALMIFNASLGALCIGVMTRTLRIRGVIAHARGRAAVEEGSAASER